MNAWKKLCLTACLGLGATLAHAQINGNSLMPPPINMTRNGWDTTLQEGNLTFGLPLAQVPGEVPIPVAFGMNATYLAHSWSTRVYDPDLGKSVPVINEIDRPMVGGVHFGYISAASTYSGTTVPGLTVLESGVQIADSQWTAFSSNTTLGTVLNLPQAYGFTAVSTSLAMVDPTATYLSYSTSLSGINSSYQSAIQSNLPTGFGTASTSYKVVMDKNLARVYAWGASVNAWIPVLWVDRFGHYVTFNWVRATTGLPTGITAITKVTATNLHSKGVVLRWADYASNTTVSDILRIDYVGVHAPSVLVQGYPGYSYLAPSGFVDSLSPDNQWTVVPSIIGASCRPTAIQVGAYGTIPQPVWSGSGPAPAVAPGAPPVDGTADSVPRYWTFGYDSNLAELSYYAQATSLTAVAFLTTSFMYSNYVTQTGLSGKCQPRGVSEVHLDYRSGGPAVQASLWKRWTRTFTVVSGQPTTLSIKQEGWWDPNQQTSPDRYHQISFPTDTLNYGNGVYQTDQLVDTTGKTTGKTTTYAWNLNGSGINSSLSSVQSVTVQQDGTPTLTTALGYPDSTKLQVTQQNVTATDASGKSYQVASTKYTYGTRWDMLEGHQLIQVDTTRYQPDGVTALPTITQKNVYDTPASGPALLQLQKSYLDGGTTGQHGWSYTYDAQGRFSSQIVYHVEGTQAQQAPSFHQFGYDPTTGSVSSDAIWDQTVMPAKSLTKTMGGFDSAGRPTTVSEPSGVMTTYTYDDRGRTLSVSKAGSPAVSYAYPNELTVQSVVNGLTTTTSYDAFGRVIQTSKPTGLPAGGGVSYTVQTPTYDVYSRQVNLREINPVGTARSQSWSYDTLDRLTSQTPYIGSVTSITYGVSGINTTQTSTYTTSLGSTIQTVTKKDPFGQTLEVDAPNSSITKASYDGFGHQTLVTITDVNNNTQPRSWTYDALGRLTSKTEPETNTQVCSNFTALNQPNQVTEAYGTPDARTRVLSYDGFGRLLSMANGSDGVSYSYTGANLTSSTRTVGGQAVSQSFVYNGAGGRLSSETTTQPGLTTTIGYTYDPATGQLTNLSYPSGRAVGYGYDALGRITSITNNGASLVSAVKFDDWGNRWQTQFASGAQDQWDADLTGTLLKQWSIGYVGGGPDVRSYVYDSATNILKTAGEWSLQHDVMGHLMEADGFGLQTNHNTDGFGNEIHHQVTGSQIPPTFQNFDFNPLVNNQIPGQTKTGALTGWNTNLRGEATQVGSPTVSGSMLGLGWDGLGLVNSVTWNGESESFLYAPSGMRVRLTDSMTASNNRIFAYSGGGLLLSEYLNPSGTPAWKRDVVYLGSLAVAEIDVNGVHELHSDHLGSPRLITKGAGTWGSSLVGTVEGTQAFGPYGENLPLNTSGYPTLTGYTGHLQADASGLIYMRGRYYSPAWHAFVNSDQGVDPNSKNQRAYAGGGPFMASDPSGMAIGYCIIVGYEWQDQDGGVSFQEVYRECAAYGDSGNQNNSGDGSGNVDSAALGSGQPQPPQPNKCNPIPTISNGIGTAGGLLSLGPENIYYNPIYTHITNAEGNVTNMVSTSRIPLGDLGKSLGVIGAAGATGYNAYQLYNGNIDVTRFIVDGAFTALGFMGPAGFAVSTGYFLTDPLTLGPSSHNPAQDPQFMYVNGTKMERCY